AYRLVAHDEDAMSGGAASAQKPVQALEHDRPANSFPIDVTLQVLPSQFPVRQQTNCVAHRLLVAREPGAQQVALARRREEDIVIADQRVVEIDSYSHR